MYIKWTFGDKSYWASMKEVLIYWWRWYMWATFFMLIAFHYGWWLGKFVLVCCIWTLLHQSPPITIHNIRTYCSAFFIFSIFFFFVGKSFWVCILIFILSFLFMDR